MERKNKKQTLEKKRKKIVAFNLSEDVINDFNNKINYNSRSKIVDDLIFDFVKKGKGSQGRNPKIAIRSQTKRGSSLV